VTTTKPTETVELAPGIRRTVLSTGFTVLSETVSDRHSVSIGTWVRSGARDEPRERLGVSHFIEHMLFKGTERRDARAIAQSLESLGGHLDAFTGREQVCYYARALAEHLPQVVDVLADLVSRPRFSPADVIREQSVVREEIQAAEDNPEDKVSETLSDLVWGDHPLGRPILGTLETVAAFDAGAIREYYSNRYRPQDLVLIGAGGFEHERLVELAEGAYGLPEGRERKPATAPGAFTPTRRYLVRPELQQLYLSLGTRTVPYAHEHRTPLVVLSTLLGGGMSSRLFQSVREEAGLAYSVYSMADFFTDCGMMSVHLGVSPDRGAEALALVRRELETLAEQGPGADEVADVRRQLRGSILIGAESVSGRMYHLAHEEMYSDRFTTQLEQVARVEAVTVEQVADVARRYLEPDGFTLSALGPESSSQLSWSATN
jgi:predicted Zn-dependent peptidase